MSKRRIPTDKEWFDYNRTKYAGWLFCFMSSSAKYHDIIYYPKNNLIHDMPLIKKFLGVTDKRTVMKYIRMLIDKGYMSEDKENYYFPFELYNGEYTLIDKDLLYNLCVTKSTITVQVFCYLKRNMDKMKHSYNLALYDFTLKEIRIALGYSANSQNYELEKAIKECLQTLKAENYINYKNIYVDLMVNDKVTKVPNYELVYVTELLPKTIEEVKEEDSKYKIYNYAESF